MVFACTLFSSSKGNCTYIRSGGNEFLIDAGVSAKRICDSLQSIGTDIKNISAIFIT
ncbi:MAG: MBL fold metallo-hydrolase, partial [Clostridia bacterium]|nr:MBL fold metallo-hydrolase [Clostridia bacterium]